MLYYYKIYKPFGVLSQFTKEAPHHQTLADLFDFPPDVYPVGRLDKDSEGLLLLTNDKSLNHQLLHPQFSHQRTYLVQVEGIPTTQALEALKTGVTIRVQKKPYLTRPAKINLLQEDPPLPERNPPIRFRKSIPTSWIRMELTEGKNRQVRRMCAAVGFPTLRLVRERIGAVNIWGMAIGEVSTFQKADLGLSQ
ncbi:MAG: pseudouridine synthase [Bacteroidota bacterium]